MNTENLYYVFEEIYEYLYNNGEHVPMHIFQELKEEEYNTYMYLNTGYVDIDRMKSYEILLMLGNDFMEEFEELVNEFEKYAGETFTDCREIVSLAMAIFRVAARHLPNAIKR
jgi:hypothetical protein